MLISKDSILNYLPQRSPFVMVDTLVDASEQYFVSTFTIKEDNIFVRDGVLSESAIIENVAQTCAAGFGFVGSQRGEEAGKLGFIGSVSKLEVFNTCEVGQLIQTEVNVISSFDSIHLVEGTASVGDTKLLYCQMKIVVG